MKLTKEDIYTALFASLLVGAVICVCVKHEMETITVNHGTYLQAGLMEYKDNGNTIYVPIYKRQE